jgi:hypothetical protein
VVISKVRRLYKIYSFSWPSSSGLRGCRRTYHTILKLADHALVNFALNCRKKNAMLHAGLRPVRKACHSAGPLYKMYSSSWPSISGLRGCRRTYHTILKLADHALVKFALKCRHSAGKRIQWCNMLKAW